MHGSPPNHALSAAARAAAAHWYGPVEPEVGPPLPPGFSGSPLAVVRPRGGNGWHVLKSFAPGTPRPRAEWVHAFVRHVAARGAPLPQPMATATAETVVTDAQGVHWELVPFVPGVAVEVPSPAQAAAALEALARLHVAAATVPGSASHAGAAPGLLRRIARAGELAARPWGERRAAVADRDAFVTEVCQRWDRAIAVFAAAGGTRGVAAIATGRAPDTVLLPVLRDVWHAHVLFAPHPPERVAGIVDAHAAGVDTPAADVARLLGSWPAAASPGDLLAAWQGPLAAYEAVRPFAGPERGLVPLLHAAGVVCGLDNWFRWTAEERRPFANPAAVLVRIDRLIDNLAAALTWLAAPGRCRV